MATFLHHQDIWTTFAEGEAGPAKDWASARLAIYAPNQPFSFPTDPSLHDPLVAAGPPSLFPALINALQAPTLELAATSAALGLYGMLPADPVPLTTALRQAMTGDDHEQNAWLALAIMHLDALQAQDLAAAAKATGPDILWQLPSLVLHQANSTANLDEAAIAVANSLPRNQSWDESPLASILNLLGVPTLPSGPDDPTEALELGATMAQGVAPPLKARGSRKRRSQKLVMALCERRDSPAAVLLRAVYDKEPQATLGTAPICAAAWLHCFKPKNPLDDILTRTAGNNLECLSEARRHAKEEDTAKIAAAFAEHRLPASIGVVALPVLTQDLAHLVIQTANFGQSANIRAEALAINAAARFPDLVPPMLADQNTRGLGLVLAEWVPTEEVLLALMTLPIPPDSEDRVQYARALAAIGDRAAEPALEAVLRQEKPSRMAWAQRLNRSLLGPG
ncbi:MAG: hypothetical protein HN348_00510 [Proteobacteria bacterium]|nr:hypothetical protein [Pseudomonadota bacterium]